MGLLKAITRKRSVAGSIGPVRRSVGYLQGGYKDVTIHSKVQLFNTLTQVGQIVYDTGYQRSYRPGLSGKYKGYFSISDTVAYNRFNYITASASAAFSTTYHPSVSVSNLSDYTYGLILATLNPSLQPSIDGDWYLLNLESETPSSLGLISNLPYGSTRQAMSTTNAGFFSTPANVACYSFNVNTNAFVGQAAPAEMNNDIQVPCGMSVTDAKGFFVGMLGRNVQLNVDGSTILSYRVATPYTYNFGESHALANDIHGFMMAGYSDTSGRYGGAQHGLCQRFTFATEAIATLPDLVLAQSSGQMMQGF